MLYFFKVSEYTSTSAKQNRIWWRRRYLWYAKWIESGWPLFSRCFKKLLFNVPSKWSIQNWSKIPSFTFGWCKPPICFLKLYNIYFQMNFRDNSNKPEWWIYFTISPKPMDFFSKLGHLMEYQLQTVCSLRHTEIGVAF